MKCLPKSIQITQVGQSYYVNVFNNPGKEIISPSVCTGFSRSVDTALLIALVEFMERRGYSEAWRLGMPAVIENSTDGLAAFPVLNSPELAHKMARLNAMKEAIERYTWATWWDQDGISFCCEEYNISDIPSLWSDDLVEVIFSAVSVKRFFLLKPKIENCNNYCVSIIFAELEQGGFISGGACEHIDDPEKSLTRSLAELARHALALSRLKASGIKPKSIYENRLLWFGSGFGDNKVFQRITRKGKIKLRLPESKVDAEVKHSFSDEVKIHRYLFYGQPPFVGGELERLCL